MAQSSHYSVSIVSLLYLEGEHAGGFLLGRQVVLNAGVLLYCFLLVLIYDNLLTSDPR